MIQLQVCYETKHKWKAGSSLQKEKEMVKKPLPLMGDCTSLCILEKQKLKKQTNKIPQTKHNPKV